MERKTSRDEKLERSMMIRKSTSDAFQDPQRGFPRLESFTYFYIYFKYYGWRPVCDTSIHSP